MVRRAAGKCERTIWNARIAVALSYKGSKLRATTKCAEASTRGPRDRKRVKSMMLGTIVDGMRKRANISCKKADGTSSCAVLAMEMRTIDWAPFRNSAASPPR